jgi:hypothetical protein
MSSFLYYVIPILQHLPVQTVILKTSRQARKSFRIVVKKKNPRTAMATSVQIKFRIVIDTILHTHVCNPTLLPIFMDIYCS